MIGGGVLLIRQRRDYLLTLAQSHHKEEASSIGKSNGVEIAIERADRKSVLRSGSFTAVTT